MHARGNQHRDLAVASSGSDASVGHPSVLSMSQQQQCISARFPGVDGQHEQPGHDGQLSFSEEQDNVANDDQLDGVLAGEPSSDVGTIVSAAGHSGPNQQQVELLQRELGQVLFAGLDMVTFLSEVSSALLKVGLLTEHEVIRMHELIISATKDGRSNILQGLSSRAKCICSAIDRQQMQFVLHHTAMLVDDVVKYA